MNKKLFLLPFLTFSLTLAGCSIHRGDKPADEQEQPGAKEIWEEDLVEGESTIDQVKAGEAGKYYKVRGTVAANSGSTLALYRGGKFLYCYNFNNDQEGNGGQTKIEAHPLGSYVEIYAQSSAYSDSIQLTAYDVGESKTAKKYDEAAVLHKLADKGETVVPLAAAAEEDFGNARAAGALLKAEFVPGKDFAFDPADTSANQDLAGKVGAFGVTLRMEKYLPDDARTALFPDDAAKTFEMGAKYEVVALAAATSSGSCRLIVAEGSSWKKTAEAVWDDPTAVLIEAEGDKDEVEVGAQLELSFTVSPSTAKPAVTWSSENPEIASVNEDGVVKGEAVGETTIIALAANSTTIKGEYPIKVVAPSKTITKVTAPVANTKYKCGLYQAKEEVIYWGLGTLSGNYGATSTDVEEAVDYELVPVDGGYNVKVTLADDTVKYMNAKASNQYFNVKYEDAASTVWTFNEAAATLYTVGVGFTGDNDSKNGVVYYCGTYGNNKTFGMSEAYRIEGDNASKIDVSGGQYPVHLYTVE